MPQSGERAQAGGAGPGQGRRGADAGRSPGAGRPSGRGAGVFAGLTLALVVALLLGTGLGAVAVPPEQLVHVLLDAAANALTGGGSGEVAPAARILVDIRLPRVFLAALVGASLAAAGSAFQTLFRNPMADPYVLGVSSGGALGAALAYLVLLGLSTGAAGAAEGPPGGAAGPAAGGLGGVAGALVRIIGFGLVPAGAFVGALGAVVAVSRLARVGGRLAVGTLLLAGVAVASL
ncbi:MAG TPA: iron chelate uptake ABC transporter family permease subunit, partial [Thermaerobacter sp.]